MRETSQSFTFVSTSRAHLSTVNINIDLNRPAQAVKSGRKLLALETLWRNTAENTKCNMMMIMKVKIVGSLLY